MNDKVELISDGDGLAIVGNPSAVERFMASVGLPEDGGTIINDDVHARQLTEKGKSHADH